MYNLGSPLKTFAAEVGGGGGGRGGALPIEQVAGGFVTGGDVIGKHDRVTHEERHMSLWT